SFAREYVEFEPASGKQTPLFGQGESVEYIAAYAAQTGELLVITNKFRDFRALYRWKIGSDASQASFRDVLALPTMDVAEFSIDHARKRIYAQTNDGGYARLVVLDANTFARLPLPLPANAEQAFAGKPTDDGRFVTI